MCNQEKPSRPLHEARGNYFHPAFSCMLYFNPNNLQTRKILPLMAPFMQSWQARMESTVTCSKESSPTSWIPSWS